MALVGDLLLLFLDVYTWVIIISVIISWLIAFGVLNMNNPQSRNLVSLMNRLTDPVMRPVSRYIPPIGGIDITPIIVIFGIAILKTFIARLFYTGGF